MNTIDLTNTPCLGVAGNFTGHLEQAGEAKDFTNVKAATNAPKAVFPTYMPNSTKAPEFLTVYPFDSESIIYPEGQTKLQIEPECAVLFKATWVNEKLTSLEPVCFGASNDCSIRREGATKISQKKNWGASSKGFAANAIAIDSFDEAGIIGNYRIASFLVRDNTAYAYGEDSRISDYSYIYGQLTDWIIDKVNNQKDEGPIERVYDYITSSGMFDTLFVSIGATRYTEFGENNFLESGDKSVVILYPENKYSSHDIINFVEGKENIPSDVSILSQTVVS